LTETKLLNYLFETKIKILEISVLYQI